MFRHRKKKEEPGENPNIIYLSKPDPVACGGRTATLDKSAPHTIVSHEMVLFDVFSALHGGAIGSKGGPIGYISAFAVPDGEGTFILLEESEGFFTGGERTTEWAWIKKDIFPALCDVAEKHGFAKNNGYSSFTHGLPQNFGGTINIKYASGESIYVADNQGAVISEEAASEIAKLFGEALSSERFRIPEAEGITAIRFYEKRKNGGYTVAELTIAPDGTAVNRKESKYDGPEIYKSEKEVDPETVAAIRRNIDDTGLLAWSGIPDNGFKSINDSELTFVFADGSETAVRSGRLVPDAIKQGYFNVQLEITTKN